MGKITHKDAANLTTANEVSQDEWKVNTLHLDSRGNTLEVSRSVTLVVAASDSSAAAKAGADYVCDGTLDDVQILAAITALPSGGGTVQLLEGNFEGLGVRIHNKSNVTIQGQGFGTIYKLKDGLSQAEADAGSNTLIWVTGTSDWVIVRDITLNGNKSNQTNLTAPGLYTYIGIYFEQVSHGFVENVYAYDCASGGIYMSNAGGGDHHTLRCIKTKTCGLSGTNDRAGIHCEGCLHVSISHWLDDGSMRGGQFDGSDLHLDDFRLLDTVGNGLHLSDAIRFMIRNGIIDTAGNYGIVFDTGDDEDAYLSDIYIKDSTNSGIAINDTTMTGFRMDRVVIDGAGTTGGFAGTGTITDGRVHQCKVKDSTANNFQVGGMTYIDCYAEGAGAGYSGFFGQDLVIIGGESKNNGTSAENGYGVRLSRGSNSRIIGLRAYDDRTPKGQKYGVWINSEVANAIVDSCDVAGNLTAAIQDDGTTSYIRDNLGYVTENDGTSSIDSGQTTKVVAHGLATTPTVINILFAEQGTADYGRWWVDTVGATNFTLNVSADPGASNLDFWWEAKVR